MAQIMVGAIFVGSMETVWSGQITPAKTRRLTVKKYNTIPITLKQGQEFGHFNMGSTVILMFEKNSLNWSTNLNSGTAVQIGQELGKVYLNTPA